MGSSPDGLTGPGQPESELARPGLRERKKARTRAAIREHAFRLFRERGYDRTTVEQIADAAEVSPSTFFRYFPTKEDVVLQDDMDLLWVEAIRAQPAGVSPLAAVRDALRGAFGDLTPEQITLLRESADLSFSVPAVRARALDEFARTIGLIATAVGERAGREPGDVAVQTMAGAVLGVAMSAWFGAEGDLVGFAATFERGLALLEQGLPL